MIQADDPRLKTAEGWVALGAPKDATYWVGPCKKPWERWNKNDPRCDQNSIWYTIIPRPVSEEAKALDEVEEVSA
jgi:hypothetical protein